MSSRAKIITGFFLIVLVVAAYLIIRQSDLFSLLTEGERLRYFCVDAGWYGPFIIIGLIAVAVVISPLPSAPIALASGMVYGNVWGTIFVVIGAEVGAVIAFGIARLAGYEFLKKWIGDKIKSARIFGSQTWMMTIVFLSRFLPFISFDIVSYAAGLTPLSFWRFAIATLAGIIPMSFLLSHIGQVVGTGEPRAIFLSSIIVGLLVFLPIVGRMIYQHKRK
jgi:uncharacterized membrane protein YdjX (TVP38/TMEM64 family)